MVGIVGTSMSSDIWHWSQIFMQLHASYLLFSLAWSESQVKEDMISFYKCDHEYLCSSFLLSTIFRIKILVFYERISQLQIASCSLVYNF